MFFSVDLNRDGKCAKKWWWWWWKTRRKESITRDLGERPHPWLNVLQEKISGFTGTPSPTTAHGASSSSVQKAEWLILRWTNSNMGSYNEDNGDIIGTSWGYHQQHVVFGPCSWRKITVKTKNQANFRFGYGSGLDIPTIGWVTPTTCRQPYPFDARCNANEASPWAVLRGRIQSPKQRQAAAAHHQRNLAISWWCTPVTVHRNFCPTRLCDKRLGLHGLHLKISDFGCETIPTFGPRSPCFSNGNCSCMAAQLNFPALFMSSICRPWSGQPGGIRGSKIWKWVVVLIIYKWIFKRDIVADGVNIDDLRLDLQLSKETGKGRSILLRRSHLRGK